MDIFELMKNAVGCEYISDLRNEPYFESQEAAISFLRSEKVAL